MGRGHGTQNVGAGIRAGATTPASNAWTDLLAGAHPGHDVPTPAEVVATIYRSGGDPNKPFFYLAGPMTDIPGFNYPRFHAVTDRLRAQGYNLVTPAELSDPETLAAIMSSATGDYADLAPDKGYHAFLGRDLVICALPTCVGAIFLEGWQHSRGARGESWVLQFLGKPMYEYSDVGDTISLAKIDGRVQRLRELGADDV